LLGRGHAFYKTLPATVHQTKIHCGTPKCFLLFESFKPSTELIHSFYFAYGGQNPTVLIEIYFSKIDTMNTISSLW
jgi:hypothetical protein